MPYQVTLTLARDLAEFAQKYSEEHKQTVQETLREGLKLLQKVPPT